VNMDSDQLETLLALPFVDPYFGFDLSPDGRSLAYSYNISGQWEIYIKALDESHTEKQITVGPGGKFAPIWSPDGRYLAYALDLNGGEFYDILIYEMATGNLINLTPDTPELILPRIAWSPDSARIAFISDRLGKFDTYVLSLEDLHVDLVFHSSGHDREVKWSPDGAWLAITTASTGQDQDTFLVPLQGGKPIPVTDNLRSIHARESSWSLDSRQVVFSSVYQGFFNIGIYDVQTGRFTWLTEGRGDKSQPSWSPDNQKIVYTLQRGPIIDLAVYDIPKKCEMEIRVEAGVHRWPQFTRDGESLISLFENPKYPNSLWLIPLNNRPRVQLTNSLPESLQYTRFVMPVEVSYPGTDGRIVPALLYSPPKSEKLCPGILYVHGGPTSTSCVSWDPVIQDMVDHGWVILVPNYRGSAGYGCEWQLANRFDLGGGDARDVISGAQYLLQEGLVDPKRLAITGVSYGGYLTMTALTQSPDLWIAGSAIVPFLNWFTVIKNEREDLQHWDRQNFGDPEKDSDLFYKYSPFFFLDRIQAPVQLVCGANDLRCPPGESIETQRVLLAMGKRCDLLLYYDEGHYFLNNKNALDYKKKRIAFFNEHLGSAQES
jgi:dipeptidyl aminopeptidase/acylaminoacyl peptidase